jgi:Zn-dependent protease
MSPLVGIGCLLFSLAVFALSFGSGGRWASLLIIIPVLFLHEMGHYLGMRLFGYRNVQMFFIPFFGAAVSGSKHAAPVWQQAIMLLLGPLPGIFLGLVLQIVYKPVGEHWLTSAVLWLVVLNGLNLVPIVPLDGGRLADLLLFARRPVQALAFRLFAVAALAGLGFFLRDWVLGVVAFLMLVGTPMRWKKAKLESAFRDNPLNLPDELEQLSDAQRRDLFGWTMLLNPLDRSPASLAADMRTLHENMVSRRPGILVWSSLVASYLLGIAAAVATVTISRQHHVEHLRTIATSFKDR